MKKIIMPLADGFEEIETMTIVDVLRRAGLSIIIAGLKSGELVGAHDIRVMPDQTLDDVKEESFDMIVLPGGQPGVDNLRKDSRVLDLLKKMKKKQQSDRRHLRRASCSKGRRSHLRCEINKLPFCGTRSLREPLSFIPSRCGWGSGHQPRPRNCYGFCSEARRATARKKTV